MKTTKTLAAMALTFLVATAPAALAKDKKQKKTVRGGDAQLTQVFGQFDANRDGRISRSEFPGDAYQFNLADRNRDGYISRTEAQQIAANRDVLHEEYRRLDTNRDGVIARGEWRGDFGTFDRLDRNNDGVLSQADRSAVAVPATASRFRGLDRNNDGRVTRGEWRGNDTSFRNQDRNRDGVISGSELRSGRGNR